MIDTSPAIDQLKVKVVYVRRGKSIMAVSSGKTPEGKWKIIDLCFGSCNQALDDLKAQGYIIKNF